MGALKRVASLGAGSALGFLIGSAVSLLLAPEQGADTRKRLQERLATIKAAGDEAQAGVEARLIQRFRDEVADPKALQPEAAEVALMRTRALESLGVGLNLPGAIAAQESRLRAGNPPVGPLDLTSGGPPRS